MDNDSLFALKLYYEDELDDEYEIIRMLKIELINQGMLETEANIRLKEFYDSFDSDIDLDIFKNIKIERNNSQAVNSVFNAIFNHPNNTPINESNTDINESNTDEEDEDDVDPLYYFVDMFINHINNTEDDVISTLNEEDKIKLKKYVLINNLEDKCSICLDLMEKEQEVIELPCKHTYHSNCINEYLSNYSYKCPCCKEEVGRPVHHI